MDRTVLVYKSHNEIRSKIIKEEKDQGQVKDNILLKSEHDILKSKNDNFGGMNYWYEDNFYIWGYQRIINDKNPNVPKKRNVFYINKVSIK